MIYITEPRDFCHRSEVGMRVILRLRVSSQDAGRSTIRSAEPASKAWRIRH